MALCPQFSASMSTASGTKRASPSTMTTASREAANTISRSLRSSSLTVGLITNSPSTRPLRPPATGPVKGNGGKADGGRSCGNAQHVGQILSVGRNGAGQHLHFVSVALGEQRPDSGGLSGGIPAFRDRLGRPISRRKKFPGIRPAAYIFFPVLHSKREKVPWGFPAAGSHTVTRATVPSHCIQTAPCACLARGRSPR